MDQKTFHILEFDKVLDRLAAYTSFSAGAQLARGLTPTDEIDEARRRQAETAEAVDLFESGSDVTIGGARDVRRAVENARRGYVLRPEDFLEIRGTLIAARNLRRALLKVESRFP
ncbi:MAG: hypothetical protein R3272_17015, partial [Candidatus Promineifilaceae bacterium]|nr:hypothetical protein [Candidatus Promineifilaceae bacterium]